MIGYTVGTYKIIEKIGEGGMGAVYRGIDVMLEREVAIKALRPELASQPDLVERFRTEAKTLARLNHPNIATVFNFLRQGDDFFMVMEFVRGETLDHTIRRFGAMPVERALPLFCQALEGLDHAHKLGIIHRDVKPANMMLSESGTVKVMDFGIARVLGSARMTKQGNIVGTIAYMSPEQVRGQETDAKSDIYSMGILLYEMLTGRVPFSSDSEYDLMKMQIEDAPPPPRVFVEHIPEAVEQAIMRSLAKRAEARFQTVGELRDVLLRTAQASISKPAPVVRLTDPTLVAPTTPHAVPKETRIASSALALPAGSGSQHQTIPRPAAAAESAYGQACTPPYQPQAVQPSSKLNWKVYSLAAAALVVVAAVSIVLLSGGSGKKEATTQPGVTQPKSPSSQSVSEPSRPTPSPDGSGATTPPPPPRSENPPLIEKPIGVGELPAIQVPRSSDSGSKQAKSTPRKDDAAAKAKAEKERKAAEARRLLNQ